MRKTKQTLKQQAKMERVVWGMLTVSLPFYGVVGYFMKDVEGSTTVVYGMAAAAVVTLMMGFLIKDLLLKKRFSGETPGTTARPGWFWESLSFYAYSLGSYGISRGLWSGSPHHGS